MLFKLRSNLVFVLGGRLFDILNQGDDFDISIEVESNPLRLDHLSAACLN